MIVPELSVAPAVDLLAQVAVVVLQVVPNQRFGFLRREVLGSEFHQLEQNPWKVCLHRFGERCQRIFSNTLKRENLVNESEIVVLEELKAGFGIAVKVGLVVERVAASNYVRSEK